MVSPPIRLVIFDVLGTLITPRLPIHVQYSQAFAPYLGLLEPDSIKRSFKIALKQLQAEKPAYQDAKGTRGWWGEVMKRTALGAGADARAVDASLGEIVPRLMTRFSSKEGYEAFHDALPTLWYLRERLDIPTAILSNADSRIRQVLQDLDFPSSLSPIVLSEEEGIEKPSPEIFLRVLNRVNTKGAFDGVIQPEECLHIGDELECDYKGAMKAGMRALLLRRPGEDLEPGEDLRGVECIEGLGEVVRWAS